MPSLNLRHSSSPVPDEVLHALRINKLAAVIGFVSLLLASFLTWQTFADAAPASRMTPWAAACGLMLLVHLAMVILFFVWKDRSSKMLSVWLACTRIIMLWSDLIVAASIWLFLPFATETQVLMMMALYAHHIPTQILVTPENPELIFFGILTVLGSAIAYLLMLNTPEARVLAIYFTSFSIAATFLSGMIRRSVREAVSARLDSDTNAAALKEAYSAVAKERDAKTQFIAAASHDLGQPLHAATLFFEQAMQAHDEAARLRAASGVQRSFAAAEQLLSHMLNHLQLEADAVEPQNSVVELAQCFRRTHGLFALQAKEAGISLRIAPCRRFLCLDPSLLDRAIGNLIQNAVIHSGANKVLIGTRVVSAEHMRIYVLDNGVGIGRADAKHIFQDFYRGSDSRASTKSGFGLGLASVRRIADLMGGHAGLDPRWTNGAAFYLEFPNRTIVMNLPNQTLSEANSHS